MPFAGTCAHLCSWISVQFSTATSACFIAKELQAVNSQWLVVTLLFCMVFLVLVKDH